jgi:hypothetical protein
MKENTFESGYTRRNHINDFNKQTHFIVQILGLENDHIVKGLSCFELCF